jgi:hypothetical protein
MQAMIGQVGLEFIERAKCRGPGLLQPPRVIAVPGAAEQRGQRACRRQAHEAGRRSTDEHLGRRVGSRRR